MTKRSTALLLSLICALLALSLRTHAQHAKPSQPARDAAHVDNTVFGIALGAALPPLPPCVPDTALPQPSDANCLKRELARAPQDPPSPLYDERFVGVSTEVFDTDALAPNPLEGMQVLVSKQTKSVERILLIAELRDGNQAMRTLIRKYGEPRETESALWLREGERVRLPVKVWRFPSLVVRFLSDSRQRLGVLEVNTAAYEAQRAVANQDPTQELPANTEPRPVRRSL